MTYNFNPHTKGDTFEPVQFTLLVNSVAVNLSGASILMQLRKNCYDHPVLSLTSASGITITNALGGVFQINKRIIDIEASVYQYDIQITFPSGEVKTYIKGEFTVINDISRG